jgi:hypothetical protein
MDLTSELRTGLGHFFVEEDVRDAEKLMEKAADEIERVRSIGQEIADTVMTDPRLFQEPLDYEAVLAKIYDLAVSIYAP